jgi:hypothetical protein
MCVNKANLRFIHKLNPLLKIYPLALQHLLVLEITVLGLGHMLNNDPLKFYKSNPN